MSQSLTWTRQPVAAHAACPRHTAAWAVMLVVQTIACRFAAYLFCAELLSTERGPFAPIALLEHPVNVFQYPWHLVVVGFSVGVTLGAPVVLAALAGTAWGVAGAGIAVVLGPSPLLGMASVGAVMLIRIRRLPIGTDARRRALGLALGPCVWLVLVATAPVADLPGSVRWVACVPALVAGLVGVGVWWFARGDRLTSQVEPSVWGAAFAVLLACAAAIVHSAVGWDEIRFGRVASQHGPDAGHFVSTPIDSRWAHEDTAQQARSSDAESTKSDPRRAMANVRDALAVQQYLAERREEASGAWLAFRRRYPASQHVPEALYVLARTLDTRVDFRAFYQHRCLVFDDTEVSRESLRFWTLLAERHPHCPESATALHRIAQHFLRQEDLASGMANLRRLVDRFGARSAQARQKPGASLSLAELFASAPHRRSHPRWQQAACAVARARHALWLIDAAMPQWRKPLQVYFQAVPHTSAYENRLRQARQTLPSGPLRQIIDIDLGAAVSDPGARVQALDRLVKRAGFATRARDWARYRHLQAMLVQAMVRPEASLRRLDLLKARPYVSAVTGALSDSPVRPLVIKLGEEIDQQIARASALAD